MKATLTWLAAILASTLTLNAASAQDPYQVAPAGYGYAGPVPGESTSNYGGHAGKGCAGGDCGSGGCASGKCGAAAGGGKLKQFANYLCCAGCPGCQKPELFHKKKGCGCNGPFKNWLCKPCPSDAPVLWHAQYPLGFPTHPYVRSPRDYFMANDP